MEIKASIASIAEKYGLEVVGESYELKIKNTIAEILNQLPKDKKIAIRGAGAHTHELLAIDGCDIKFECIFDYSKTEKVTEEIAGKKWDIYPCSFIDETDVDIMVISSFTHRRRIAGDLKKSKRRFKIFDIYDELQKKGLDVNAPFYRNAEDAYENVIYYRKIYFADKNADSLKNLIIAYLKIYDFINFEKYSGEYISNQYPYFDKVQMAVNEIKQLLDEVKVKIKARTQRDIITVWNDQVDYGYLQYASYMKEVSRDSMFFENAYTMTPFTVPTFLEMFQGLKSIDDGIYHKPFPVADKNNSRVLKTLDMAGYEFVYIGDEADAKMFEEKNVVAYYTYNSTCIRCVDLLQKLLDTEKPVCVVLHALVETHNPYLSGELDDAKYYEWPTFAGDPEEKALEQRKKSLEYWDKQLAYYMDFMPDKCIKIFMSDHGARYNFQSVYKEATTHIIFFIVGGNVPQGRYKRMFSIYNFYKIISCIIHDEYKEDEIFDDYVLMQETNIFNKAAIRFYIESKAERCICGFRAARTEKELYVKLSSGQRYYYLLPDENTNHIGGADVERLGYLDKVAGDKFEDTSEYEKELMIFRKQFETHE